MKELFNKLKIGANKIVCSSQLNEVEIAIAKSNGDFYVDEDGFGFALVDDFSINVKADLVGVIK